MAASYYVVMNGVNETLFGTSASAPVVAGMVALVNSARLSMGKSALGWINPSLYSLSSSIILNDITVGENNCVAGHSASICCEQGFTAGVGWDPATGLGSLNFTAFKNAFMKLDSNMNAPSFAPTVGVTAPSSKPVAMPTMKPTRKPTSLPTQAPGWVTYSFYSGEVPN
jgi:hypothetical protein